MESFTITQRLFEQQQRLEKLLNPPYLQHIKRLEKMLDSPSIVSFGRIRNFMHIPRFPSNYPFTINPSVILPFSSVPLFISSTYLPSIRLLYGESDYRNRRWQKDETADITTEKINSKDVLDPTEYRDWVIILRDFIQILLLAGLSSSFIQEAQNSLIVALFVLNIICLIYKQKN